MQPSQPIGSEARVVDGLRQVKLGENEVISHELLAGRGAERTQRRYFVYAQTSNGNTYLLGPRANLLDLRSIQAGNLEQRYLVRCSDIALGRQFQGVWTDKDGTFKHVITSPLREVIIVEDRSLETMLDIHITGQSDQPFPIVEEYDRAYTEALSRQGSDES